MDAIIYTDGHGTKVTDHEFVAGNAKYLIDGIVNARINRVHSSAMPGIICLMLGLIMAAGAFMSVFDDTILTFSMGNLVMTPNRVAGLAGFVLILIGIIALLWRDRKYSVHITTAEGERDPLVSKKKDYVRQIVAAINSALKHARR